MAYQNVINDGEIDGVDVEATGTLVLGRAAEPNTGRKGVKLIVLTNASDVPIYLAFKNSPDPDAPTNQAEVGKGIYLSPNGGSYEANEMNTIWCEIWAIHDDTGLQKRLCVQIGR